MALQSLTPWHSMSDPGVRRHLKAVRRPYAIVNMVEITVYATTTTGLDAGFHDEAYQAGFAC